MPTPTIPDGELFFNATTFDGVTGGGTVTNSGSMQPDFVWMKVRNNANNHELADSVRGTPHASFSNLTNAEVSDTRVSAFNSNGFSYGTNSNSAITGRTVVAWQWKAGGAAVTNTAGSISSQVSANTTSGFSVVTFNTGSAGNKTVGHGLGVSPAMFIVKNRDGGASQHWNVWHQSFATPSQGYIYLDLTNGVANDSRQWANTAPTSSVFSFESAYTFPASVNMVAYCWSEIEGFSKFGSYTGNGSTDGTFVYLGFRPRFVMIKSTGSQDWVMLDSARAPTNVAGNYLRPNSGGAENSGSIPTTSTNEDFLSNGIKFRNDASSSGYTNGSGVTYIYMAFAENPFKYANAR